MEGTGDEVEVVLKGAPPFGCYFIPCTEQAFDVQGIKGKSVELLAPNRIVNSAKSSTDLPSHPSTSIILVSHCCRDHRGPYILYSSILGAVVHRYL